MKYILFMFFLGTPGPYAEYLLFPSYQECEKMLKGVPVRVEQFNKTVGEHEQVKFWSASCNPVAVANGVDL